MLDEQETMRQLRRAVMDAIGSTPLEHAARVAECSPTTLHRIARGENVQVRTVARICARLGSPLEIRITARNTNLL